MARIKIFSKAHPHRSMIKDIIVIAEEILQERKKQFSSLRFAKPAVHGWSFLKKKRKHSWEIMEAITERVSVTYPQYSVGSIAHMLSEIVNSAKKDLSSLQTDLEY